MCLQYNDGNEQPIGGTYALKFQLCDGSGANLSSPQISVVAGLIDDSLPPAPDFQGKSNLGFEFRYDPKGKFYIYNLDTTTPGLEVGPHELAFTVNGTSSDGYVLPFILK